MRKGTQFPHDMAATHELTDLQIAILGILWRSTEATVTEVHSAMPGRDRPSRQTVNTLLWRLERRGFVTRVSRGATARYRAKVSRKRVLVERLAALLSAILEPGDVAPAAVGRADVDPGDVKRLRALLRQAEQDLGSGSRGKGRAR